MVLRLRQHNIGYTADGFYDSDIIMWQKMKVTDGIKSQKKDKIKVLVLVTPILW